MDRAELTPGSDRAADHGCLCPAGDNARGRGIKITNAEGTQTMFWINGACPIHGKPEAESQS